MENITSPSNSITSIFQLLKEEISSSQIQQQKNRIAEDSPYSSVINEYISNYREFYLYYTLKLQEATVTRPALIKEIDPDLYVSSENKTNYELMSIGKPPYAYDEPDAIIELHHIGQDFDAPFAELTQKEHLLYGNSKVFHASKKESWRNDKSKLSLFNKERTKYWKLRAANKIDKAKEIEFTEIEDKQFLLADEIQDDITDIAELLFKECSVENLDYLSDLAKSYSLIKQTGASTVAEFIINNKANKEITCTRCKSKEYIFYGSYQTVSEKIQRYKCKKCDHVFTATSKSLISNSQFAFLDWIKFIDCLYNGYSINKTARICNISESTAYNNRLKLFYALKLLDDQVVLEGNIAIDETFYPVSYKGNHSQNEDIIIPREIHKRGGENHEKGLGKNQVCVVCALDENGNSVAHIAGTGNSSADKINTALEYSINKLNVECLYTDKSLVLNKFAKNNSFKIVQKKAIGTENSNKEPYNPTATKHLQRMNSYHSRLKRFLANFSGISTKHLSGYLYLFAWKERNRDRNPVEAYKELLAVLTEPNNYKTIEDITEKKYLPDAIEISKKARLKGRTERDKIIYDRWAAGESMESIGASFGISKQRVHQSIEKTRRYGEAYKTQRQIKREEKMTSSQAKKDKKKIENLKAKRLLIDAIYYDYLNMVDPKKNDGSRARFLEFASEKYQLKETKINQYLATANKCKEIHDTIPFKEYYKTPSLEEIYNNLYSDYTRIKAENPEMEKHSLLGKAAELHNVSIYTAHAVVSSIESPDFNGTFYSPQRILPSEAITMNKALFGEYIRFTKYKSEFNKYAEEKYDILLTKISNIIETMMLAYPEEFDKFL